MKNRIRRAVTLLVLSCVIILLILTYLFYNTLQLQNNKFRYSTNYLTSSEFYKYSLHNKTLNRACTRFIEQMENEHDSVDIVKNTEALIDSVRSTFSFFTMLNNDIANAFILNNIDVDFKTKITLGQFKVSSADTIYDIIGAKTNDYVCLFGDCDLSTGESPLHFWNFQAKNYSLQLNFYMEFGSLLSYYLRNIKYVIYGALIIFIVFSVIVMYTIRTIYKQEEYVNIKNNFINNITHEIQTPITTISIACKTLKSPAVQSSPNEALNLIESIENQSKRLSKLVNKVLNISVLKRRFELNKEPVKLSEELDRIRNEFMQHTYDKAFKLELLAKSSKYLITADRFYLEMLVVNLIDNAIKYSRENIHIQLKLSEYSKHVEMEIKDNGIGIEKKYRKHLFKEFYRIPTGNIHKIKGTGLGLYYVYLIVCSHQWKIKVRSQPGQGTSFIIRIPKT